MARYISSEITNTCHHCDLEYAVRHTIMTPDVRGGDHMHIQGCVAILPDGTSTKNLKFYMYSMECPKCNGNLGSRHFVKATEPFAQFREEWFAEFVDSL